MCYTETQQGLPSRLWLSGYIRREAEDADPSAQRLGAGLGGCDSLGHFGSQVRRHLSVAALNDDIAACM